MTTKAEILNVDHPCQRSYTTTWFEFVCYNLDVFVHAMLKIVNAIDLDVGNLYLYITMSGGSRKI